MRNVNPIANCQLAFTADIAIRKVAVHVDVRRTAKLHDNLALSLLVAPADDRCVGLLRSKPRLRRVRRGSRGQDRDVVTTVYSLAT